MRFDRFSPILPTLALALCTTPAAAQWSPGGLRLCQGGCAGYVGRIIPDGAGGAYVAWAEVPPETDSDIYLQRITASGTVAPGWPPRGLPVVVLIDSQDLTDLAPDGRGGVLIVWQDFRNSGTGGTSLDVYAQRIQGDGSIAPGWPVNGAPATRAPDYQESPLIAPDGAGGAYVTWTDWRDYPTHDRDVYAQHLTPGGAVAPGWPDNGLPVCTLAGPQAAWSLVRDDNGGVVVVWADGRNGALATYAQHLQADGSIAPGWVANGLLVVGRVTRGGAVADGSGGFYAGAAVLDLVDSADSEYYVQHFTFAGSRSEGWPEGGLKVCGAPLFRFNLRISADGAGGALLTWYDYRTYVSEIYASRVLPEGVLAPGWGADGTAVSDLAGPGSEFDPDIAPDGAGGAYVVWRREDSTGEPNPVQHLTARGAVAPGWPAYGVRLSPTRDQFDSRIASDGLGGAIVAWDQRLPEPNGIWAQRFVMDGVVAAQVSLVSASADPGRVLLVWHVAESLSFRGTVERRSEGSEWQALGTVYADGTGQIEYEDRDVGPGGRYAYRLGWRESGVEQFSAETWVDVPAALTLALEGARPNPVVGPLSVAFTLPRAEPATLALLDVSGREVLAREVGSLGAGSHVIRFGECGCTPAGMYWLRLSQAGRVLVKRAAVIR